MDVVYVTFAQMVYKCISVLFLYTKPTLRFGSSFSR